MEEMERRYASLIYDRELSFSVHVDDTVDLKVDRHKIWSMLNNLIYNALRHTPKGGSISLYLRGNGEQAVLTVDDIEGGINVKHLPHIFGRLCRISPDRGEKDGSNGLGLHIVKTTMEAMGGTVRVESTLGERTVFTLTLPARVRSSDEK